uniref:Retrovirus-related Pol polyprotein from transposon TNT 1-94 n=1 Tax=Lygus hesperus TaxID=30085 RepID=A0A0A9WLY1_LYGHE
MASSSSTSILLQMYPIISSENFPHWKLRIRTILEEKKVLEAIDTTDADRAKLTADAETVFKEKDATARNLILQSITDRHIGYIREAKSAYQMMKNMSAVFERKSTSARFMLMEKLFTLQYRSNEDLQEFYNKLDSIFTELSALGGKMDEQDKICCLLVKLKNDYQSEVAAIDAMNDELTMSFVKNKLLDAEIKRKRESGGESSQNYDQTAFYSKNYRASNSNPNHNKPNQNQASYQPYHSNFQSFNGHQHRGHGAGFRGRRRGNRGGHFKFQQNRAFAADAQAQERGSEVSFVALNIDEHVYFNQTIDKNYQFIIDSGCTNHCVREDLASDMIDVHKMDAPVQIKVANGQTITSWYQGKLRVCFGKQIMRIPALIVPGIVYNLLSVKMCNEKGFDVWFSNGSAEIINQKANVRIKCSRLGNLYCVNFERPSNGPDSNAQCLAAQDENLWHRRLGHLNRRALRNMGLPASDRICPSCVSGKMTRLPFKKNKRVRSTRIGQLLFTDLGGPVKIPTYENERYWQVILDDFSHFCVVYLLKNKSEAETNMINFIKRLENDKKCKVSNVQCDNGGEFRTKNFQNFCINNGIKIRYTMPYSSQMNGSAERLNRTLQDRTRTLLNETKLPKELWGEAIRTAAYTLNRSPSAAIDGEIPVKLMNGRVDLDRLRVFGSKCWKMNIPKGDKFEDRAIPTRLVGYQDNGYRLFCPATERIVTSRDVVFDENDFVHEKTPDSPTYIDVDENPEIQNSALSPNEEKEEEENDQFFSDEGETTEENDMKGDGKTPVTEKRSRTGRLLNNPKHLKDFELYSAYCLCAEIPTSYGEATKMGPEWKTAIGKELEAHAKFKTWSPASLPQGKKPIETRWVFTRKYDGTAKARLVAKGYQEQDSYPGLYYAPVARMTTVRTFLSVALMKNWKISYYDIPTAFLNAYCSNDIYIYPPEGVLTKSDVMKLNRPLYGLRESPAAWSQTLQAFLAQYKLTQSKRDVCLYTNEKVMLVVFVDDILTAGHDSEIAAALKEKFSARQIPEITEFLGFSLSIKKEAIEISQAKAIDKLTDRFNLSEPSKPTRTPMEHKFKATEGEIVVKPYRELIGGLLYISLTSRPDITFSVAYLSRFLDAPTTELWTAAKRVLKYLKSTKNLTLTYTNTNATTLNAYTDADWANGTDKKSTSGFAIFHGNNLVSWGSKKQVLVALSSTESEYIGAALATMELVYIQGIMVDICPKVKMKSTLFIDNMSASSLIKSYENSKRTKHIDVKFHYVKDMYRKGEVDIQYVPTAENVSDIFTKALNYDKFEKFRNILFGQFKLKKL